MSPNKDEFSNSIAIKKMFCESTETLTVRELRDPSYLIVIPELLSTGRCKIINFFESEEPDMVLNFLSLLHTTKNVVNELHIDIWNTNFDKFMILLKRAIEAHSQSLDYLALKCRLSNDYLLMVFDFLPKRLKMLDISENTFIETSELERLKMLNCNMKNELLDEFVNLLLEIENPFPLSSIHGIDISTSLEIPINVRKYSKEAPKSTRRRQLRYLDRCKSTRQGCCIQFIDYVRNSIFMKRLVGSKVRVWWPPTKDDNKTAFAGRFWPATVMMVNPADMVFVVKYDNDDIEHVPCKYVQPLSPYKYGGGLVGNYLHSILGNNNGFNIINRFMSLDSGSTKRCVDSVDHYNSSSGFVDRYNNLFNVNETEYSNLKRRMYKQPKNNIDSSSIDEERIYNHSIEFRTPESTSYNSFDSTCSGSTGYSGSTKTTICEDNYNDSYTYNNDLYNTNRYNNDNNIKNNNIIEFINSDTNINLSIETVERNLDIDSKFDGNILIPGEFCELRDPLDQFRNDPSDYVGVVKSVCDKEPIYECICIYQDNEEIMKVNSNDIRRLVLIPWYNWVNLAFKILIYYNRQMSECLNKTPDRYHDKLMNNSNMNINIKKNNNIHYNISSRTTEDTPIKIDTDSDDMNYNSNRDNNNDTYSNKDKDINGKLRYENTSTYTLKYELNFSVKQHPFTYLNECLYYLQPAYLDDLRGCSPRNPLEMRLTTVQNYMEFIPKNLHNHIKFKIESDPLNSYYNDELKIKSLMEYNEILQKELQIERNKNIELQSKLNCILCFDTQINCMLDPCAHFSFCYGCAQNLRNCPICRHKINKLKVLRLN